jgi:hypothetical protein
MKFREVASLLFKTLAWILVLVPLGLLGSLPLLPMYGVAKFVGHKMKSLEEKAQAKLMVRLSLCVCVSLSLSLSLRVSLSLSLCAVLLTCFSQISAILLALTYLGYFILARVYYGRVGVLVALTAMPFVTLAHIRYTIP